MVIIFISRALLAQASFKAWLISWESKGVSAGVERAPVAWRDLGA